MSTGPVGGVASGDSPIVATVIDVCREVVGDEGAIGPDTSIFDAGVESLAVVELILGLESRFAVKIPFDRISRGGFATPKIIAETITGLLG